MTQSLPDHKNTSQELIPAPTRRKCGRDTWSGARVRMTASAGAPFGPRRGGNPGDGATTADGTRVEAAGGTRVEAAGGNRGAAAHWKRNGHPPLGIRPARTLSCTCHRARRVLDSIPHREVGCRRAGIPSSPRTCRRARLPSDSIARREAEFRHAGILSRTCRRARRVRGSIARRAIQPRRRGSISASAILSRRAGNSAGSRRANPPGRLRGIAPAKRIGLNHPAAAPGWRRWDR